MIHELKKTIFVNTPHGEGQVLFIIDYGIHQNTIWVVANMNDGKIRHYDSNDLSITENHTIKMNKNQLPKIIISEMKNNIL